MSLEFEGWVLELKAEGLKIYSLGAMKARVWGLGQGLELRLPGKPRPRVLSKDATPEDDAWPPDADTASW